MSDLPVPGEASDAWVHGTRDPLSRVPTVETIDANVRAVSRPVVVAELRRLAESVVIQVGLAHAQEDSAFYWGLDAFADALRDRADALERES